MADFSVLCLASFFFVLVQLRIFLFRKIEMHKLHPVLIQTIYDHTDSVFCRKFIAYLGQTDVCNRQL